jgi:hypothetical protein
LSPAPCHRVSGHPIKMLPNSQPHLLHLEGIWKINRSYVRAAGRKSCGILAKMTRRCELSHLRQTHKGLLEKDFQ